jgi:HAD superfamily hydrolase (TIGR01509 family)
LDDIFEQQYYSSEIGMRKPNVDCFQYVLDQNGLEPSETLFIDDSMQHVEGARKLKIKAYHLKQEEDITTLFLDKAQ